MEHQGELTAEELRELDGKHAVSVKAPPRGGQIAGAPAWAVVPPDLVVPPGEVVMFLRLPKAMTRGAEDHHVILWELNYADEKRARSRAKARGEADYLDDLTMQSIRAIDGARADWSGEPGPGAVLAFYDKGARYRGRFLLKLMFQRMHNIDPEESMRFFADCVASGSG